ncbi:hypothetical protein Cgig2_014044 [Carnegiea gigantea]|uniref:Pentatricopeptide repeat-containing protein n=1 Tax=Carnegiea gigantea TaxID=171969 RepID=A0A9Q1QQY4_9CARY|nr:hypothetical protein Cgig2_014044 [Carnegiea gigantea]
MRKFKPSYLIRLFCHSSSIQSLSVRAAPIIDNCINFHLDPFLSHQFLGLQSLLQSHAFIIVTGNQNNVFFASKLISLYASLCRPDLSTRIFDSVHCKDSFLWNSIIKSHFSNGDCRKALDFFLGMRFANCPPNNFTIPMAVTACAELLGLDYGEVIHGIGEDGARPNERSLEGGLQACANLGALMEGKCLHGFAIKDGYGLFQDIQSSLLSMYSKWGDPEQAYRSFCGVGNNDIMSWTSVIAAYSRLGHVTECIVLLQQMLNSGVHLDEIVTSCVLSAFSNPMWVHEGKAFHGLIMRRSCVLDQVVQKALISMYCKFGKVASAERIFDSLQERNSETWNLMIFEYGKGRHEGKCMSLFREMLHRGIECDSNALISVISSCSLLGTTLLGKSLHCYVIKRLPDENTSVSNSLIDMYGKCGQLKLAKRIFSRIQRNTVSWNALISACTCGADLDEAIVLFDEMILEGSSPNSATLVSMLSACSRLVSLEKGMKLHNYISEMGIELNVALATALVDMYGKCGKLERSRQIFDSMNERDVISWNAMISCYGMHGDARAAIEVYKEMEESDISPNGLTFLAVLSACSHAGLVEEGKCFFQKMGYYSVAPTIKHYACFVDLLGKSGNLQEAEDIVLSMPMMPDGGIWGALLSACKIQNELEMGIRIAQRAIEADPKNDGYYVSVSSMLDSTGNSHEAEKFRELMKEKGLRKRLGWSML